MKKDVLDISHYPDSEQPEYFDFWRNRCDELATKLFMMERELKMMTLRKDHWQQEFNNLLEIRFK